MRYLPLSPDEIWEMLVAVGLNNIEDLFANIPNDLKLHNPLNLPNALSEIELRKLMHVLADENYDATKAVCFAGGTGYYHYIPSSVNRLAALPELLTSYTPYQPELSQGILTAIFEYQTCMVGLTGLPISNASLYDGSTALCEAARMVIHQADKPVIAISNLVHPSYVETLKSFASFDGFEIRVINNHGTRTCPDHTKRIAGEVAAIIIQSPNVTGTIEDVESLSRIAKENGTYFIQVITEVASFGILKQPGKCGVDICCGEAQSFGNALSFGGPHMGFITCTEEFLRRLPGRIVGETTDRHGNRALTLTLRPREQDIKREKATSNICTNNSNSMLRSLIYLLLMGKQGLREVATQCYNKTHYLADKAKESEFEIVNTDSFFNEVTLKLHNKPANFDKEMLSRGFIVSPTTPQLHEGMKMLVVAVTEMITKDEIDAFISTLAEVVK